jgi:hypothetical protein
MVSQPEVPAPNAYTRPLWLALMIFFSLVVGTAAGLLDWAGGNDPFHSVLTGGTSSGGVLVVLLAAYHFLK